MTNSTTPKIFILAYRFMDDGRPHLDKCLTWDESDIKSTLVNIHSLLTVDDEVLLIDAEDYNRIMMDKPTDDWQEFHEHIRSYSINIWKGENA